MLANWCMTCRIQPQYRPAVLVADWVAALLARSPARSCSHVAAFQASSPISHVIPLQLLQTLNLRRWNCSVLSDTRKMTVGNYVRLFRQSPVIPFWLRAGPALVPRWSRRGLPGWLPISPRATASYRTLHAAQAGQSHDMTKTGAGACRLRLNRSYS